MVLSYWYVQSHCVHLLGESCEMQQIFCFMNYMSTRTGLYRTFYLFYFAKCKWSLHDFQTEWGVFKTNKIVDHMAANGSVMRTKCSIMETWFEEEKFCCIEGTSCISSLLRIVFHVSVAGWFYWSIGLKINRFVNDGVHDIHFHSCSCWSRGILYYLTDAEK